MRPAVTTLLLTAAAPTIWGTTYIVTTELLPGYSPMIVAMLRALPAGLLLLLVVRQLPTGIWWLRSVILGALNFSVFWSLLFVSAYRLPGGVAATVGAVQPLIVIFLAALILDIRIRILSVVAAIAGLAGVALLVLTSKAALDALGVVAGLAAACSMGLGTVLTRKWQPPSSLLAFTAWQLTAGGLLLLPLSLLIDTSHEAPTMMNLIGLFWLSLIGAALTYIVWFKGVIQLDPTVVSSLGFLSPITAVLVGWVCLQQTLTPFQILGAVLVIGSIWLGQYGTNNSLLNAKVRDAERAGNALR
jgi:probable blue pigment (indigoidine) exporter